MNNCMLEQDKDSFSCEKIWIDVNFRGVCMNAQQTRQVSKISELLGLYLYPEQKL